MQDNSFGVASFQQDSNNVTTFQRQLITWFPLRNSVVNKTHRNSRAFKSSTTLAEANLKADPLALAEAWQLADPIYSEYSRGRNEQRLALATFYFATGGDNWTNNEGWLSYDINECKWHSGSPFDQVCDAESNYLRLHLDNNNLTGTIPAETSFLSTLIYMDLSFNSLTGTIPSTLQNLTNLDDLNLAFNALNGSITLGLFTQLTSLRHFSLTNNLLTGSIPSEVRNLQR